MDNEIDRKIDVTAILFLLVQNRQQTIDWTLIGSGANGQGIQEWPGRHCYWIKYFRCFEIILKVKTKLNLSSESIGIFVQGRKKKSICICTVLDILVYSALCTVYSVKCLFTFKYLYVYSTGYIGVHCTVYSVHMFVYL